MNTRIASIVAVMSVISLASVSFAAPRSGSPNERGSHNSAWTDKERGGNYNDQRSQRYDDQRPGRVDDQRDSKYGDRRGMKRGDERGMKMGDIRGRKIGHQRDRWDDNRRDRDGHTEVIIVNPSHRRVPVSKPYPVYKPAPKANTISINITLRL